MENSFFEFRNENMDVSMASVQDTDDVIDNSVMEESFTVYRKPVNQMATVVPESDESTEESSESDIEEVRKLSKSDNVAAVYTSDEDEDMHDIAEKSQSKLPYNQVNIASSSDEEGSPELIPKRRPGNTMTSKLKEQLPPPRPSNANERQKSMDSIKSRESSTSINKANLTDTPVRGNTSEAEESFIGIRKKKIMMLESDTEEEFDEDEVGFSAATRMSIMGVRPKDMDSDESDFIQSDESDSTTGSKSSLTHSNMADVQMTPQKPPDKADDVQNISVDCNDDSRLTCSPIQSPDKDVSMTQNDSVLDLTKENSPKGRSNRSVINERVLIDLTNRFEDDDEVKVVETKQDIIDISSDEEDNENDKKSRKSPKSRSLSPNIMRVPKKEQASMDGSLHSQDDLGASYVGGVNPYQKVVYVKKSVRDNEMKKLNELKLEVDSVEHIMKTMALNTLPDKGLKLKQRLNKLKMDVRTQEEKVAAMVVEPDNPTAADIARDGFGLKKDLTWDDIQAVSDQVQPRMFGKQAMSTHMAERTLILDRLRDLHESLGSRPPESSLATQPNKLKTKLMSHQLHALAWLKWRETQKPRGGILADDMGLGKTITMIALVLSNKDKIDEDDDDDGGWKGKKSSVRGGTLVVCPASLLQQWSGEVDRHCASHALTVTTHHGASRDTRPSALSGADLVLTTYNILQRDKEKNGVLMKIRWSRIILDEAHIVRNHKSATSAAVSALLGDNRWCLTGTPVQNKDLDVFALLKFMQCTPFDDLTMWKKWIDNKSLGGQERLSTIMRCLLLRRTKQQLQELGTLTCLPDRTLHKVEVTLTKEEMNVYQKVLVFSKTLFAQFLKQRAEKELYDVGVFLPNGSGKGDPYAKMHKKMVKLHGAKPVKSHEILVLLLRLRQLCCHCGLIASMLDGTVTSYDAEDGSADLLAELKKMQIDEKDKIDDEDEETGTEQGSTVAEAIRSVLSPNNPVFNLNKTSSKIISVIDCLKKNVFVNRGEKAVIVSQWTSVLRLVEKELSSQGIHSVTLSGNVAVNKRAAIVDSFNRPQANPQIMLLSLCAGGVGLNLCGGNHLLLLDPHWNPQLEQQAQDRIYRVGQMKPVHIYRFVTLDTVEQHIRLLQEKKLQVAESVLTGARHNNASKLSIEDLKVLFNMGKSGDD